jgi:hypothetical protein
MMTIPQNVGTRWQVHHSALTLHVEPKRHYIQQPWYVHENIY